MVSPSLLVTPLHIEGSNEQWGSLSSTDSQHDLPDNAVAVFARNGGGEQSGSIMLYKGQIVVPTAAHGFFDHHSRVISPSAKRARLFHCSLDEEKDHPLVPLVWKELRLYSAYNRSDGKRDDDVAVFVLDHEAPPFLDRDINALPFPDLVSAVPRALVGRSLNGRGFYADPDTLQYVSSTKQKPTSISNQHTTPNTK